MDNGLIEDTIPHLVDNSMNLVLTNLPRFEELKKQKKLARILKML